MVLIFFCVNFWKEIKNLKVNLFFRELGGSKDLVNGILFKVIFVLKLMLNSILFWFFWLLFVLLIIKIIFEFKEKFNNLLGNRLVNDG